MTTEDPTPPPPPDRALSPQIDEPHRVVGGMLVRRDLVKDDGRRIAFYDSTPE